ncbi:MAG: AraC family transcriptional regulator [Opitutaceae bacterium]
MYHLGGVPTPKIFVARPWLESPLQTPVGGLQLAGALENNEGIDPKSMRILGSYALIYILAADGYYADARGTRQDLGAGDVVLIFPDVAQAYGPKRDTAWRHLYFVFEGPQFDLWRKRGLLDPTRPVWRAEPVDFWARRLEETLQPDEDHGPAAALRTLGRWLDTLTALLAVRDGDAPDRPAGAWLGESQRLLGGPDARGWPRPQAVARAVGLSYENFRKQFAVRTGVSPGQFQKRKRIDRARSAIYQGDRTLKQLAEELEFSDVFHFSKTFKQVTGTTPSEFRRQVRGR